MKKLSPDYFGWLLLLLFDLCLCLFWVWIIKNGLDYDRDYTFDLTGYSLSFVGGIVLIWNLYEIWILISFLKVELGRSIYVNAVDHSYCIQQQNGEITFNTKEIEEVIYCNKRVSTRTPTAHLSYAQIKLNTGEVILITSFVLNNVELRELIFAGFSILYATDIVSFPKNRTV